MKSKFKFCLILKIVGVVLLVPAIVLIVLAASSDPFNNFGYIIGAMFCGFAALTCLMFGFVPQVRKAQLELMKQFQEDNMEELTSISNNNAKINEQAVVNTASAIKKGLNEEHFCESCGAKVSDKDKFCSFCGNKIGENDD